MADRSISTKIEVHPVRAEDADEIFKLHARVFHQREPITQFLGFSTDRLVQLLHALHRAGKGHSLDRKLWWMACDEDRAPIGFVICLDVSEAAEEPYALELTSDEQARMPPVKAFMEELRTPLRDAYASPPGQCMYVAAVGVDPVYERTGIAASLLGSAITQAREIGYVCAVSECTGPASRRCHEKCGFRSVHSLEYKKFQFEGRHPFAEIPGECHLMWKRLVIQSYAGKHPAASESS